MSNVQRAASTPSTEHGWRCEGVESFIRERAVARQVLVTNCKRLSGGAIQENWLMDVAIDGGPMEGTHQWVLRSDATSSVDASLSRVEEFQVLNCVHEAGVKVPRPLWCSDDHQVIGRSFLLMERVSGSASGHQLTKNLGPNGNTNLAMQLGSNLALLHRISPHAGLSFLAPPRHWPALSSINIYRKFLDGFDRVHPVLEWGLRWCEVNAPDDAKTCLLHRDYRTGNYLADESGLQAILDWEFTGWGDPREDIGWFTARCWRFGRPDLEAGGVGRLEDFLRGYSQHSSVRMTMDDLRYWQTMATLRWAIIALQQAKRHLSGDQISLELALTGRMLPELELEILTLIEGARR